MAPAESVRTGAAGLAAGAGAGRDALAGAGGMRIGGLEHATRVPTIATLPTQVHTLPMTLLLLEALGAGLIFVAIIWWTMFAGRKGGELPPDETPSPEEKKD